MVIDKDCLTDLQRALQPILPNVRAKCPNCRQMVEGECNIDFGMDWSGEAEVKCWNCGEIVRIPWEIDTGVPYIKEGVNEK